jgi:hypothetical protein
VEAFKLVEYDIKEVIQPFLVELVPKPGMRQLSLSALSREDMELESAEAMDNAMKAIQTMARRISSSMNDLETESQPSRVEVQFGLKLDTEGGALVSKNDEDATIKVKLILSRPAVPPDPGKV